MHFFESDFPDLSLTENDYKNYLHYFSGTVCLYDKYENKILNQILYLKKPNMRILKMLNITPSLAVLISVFTILLGCTGSGFAKQCECDVSKITVGSSAEVLVPADIINLSVTIGITTENAEMAFQRHKEKESYIAGLLQQLNIDEEEISYQPMSIRPNRQRDGSIHTSTSQRISVKMEDFDIFMDVQKKLIDNGFDNFSASFYSTEFVEGGKEALTKAIELARNDAQIMAEAAGNRLGKVININHGESDYSPALRTEYSAVMLADSPSMMDFAQTISVRKNVIVVFELLE